MAQPNTAQREPSMEEILASIRRIIEDSEAGRKSEDTIDFGRADNDHASAVTQARQPEESGTVLDVEAFRAELRAPARAAQAAKPAPMDFLDRAEPPAFVREVPKPVEPEPVVVAPKASIQAMPSVDDWRLGAPQAVEREPQTERFASDHSGSVDAMLEEAITADGFASRFAHEEPGLDYGSAAKTETFGQDIGPARNAIISDHTGRQVAAAFGDLADALAQRSQKSIETMAEDMLRPMLQDWLDNNLPHLVERLVREEIERVARGS